MADVIELDGSIRTDIVLAFAKRRAALAELKANQANIERLIEKLDKDGELKKAIQESQQHMQSVDFTNAKLNEVIAKAQEAAGKPLEGYLLNGDDGTFTKPEPQPEAAPAEEPKK